MISLISLIVFLAMIYGIVCAIEIIDRLPDYHDLD